MAGVRGGIGKSNEGRLPASRAAVGIAVFAEAQRLATRARSASVSASYEATDAIWRALIRLGIARTSALRTKH